MVRFSSCALFADYTLAYSCNCKPRNAPCCAPSHQSDVNMIYDWSLKWNTIFNAMKSQHMIIVGRCQECVTNFHLSIDGKEILPVSDTKHLGVHLSCNLSWSVHISKLVKLVSPKIVVLKCLAYRAQLSPAVLSLLYKTLARSRLEFASVVWDDCSAEDARTLKKTQLSLARAVLPDSKKQELLATLDWSTLPWRRQRSNAIYFWHLVNGRGPPILANHLPTSVRARCKYLMCNPCLSSLLFVLAARCRSFIRSAAYVWNSLPVHISSETSPACCTRSLDSHFSADRFLFGLFPS